MSEPRSSSKEKIRAVLDIRSTIDDGALAVHPSQCLFIPAAEVIDRFVELPIKHSTQFLCLHDPTSSASRGALDLLMAPEGGYAEDIQLLDANAESTWEILREEGFLVLDAGEVREKMKDRTLRLRLWRPSPLMPSFVDTLVSCWKPFLATEELWILDAGAGKGRNAVFLAGEIEKRAPFLSSAGCITVLALEIRRIIAHRAAEFFRREGFLPDPKSSRRAVAVIGSCSPLESLFVPPVAVKKAPSVEDLGEKAPYFPRELGRYNAALFIRFSHGDGLVELARQLAVADEALRSAGRKAARPPFILAVECFHVSSPRPKERAQKFCEGEVMSLLERGERQATARAIFSPSRWKAILERLGDAEDGRPTLQGIYCFAFD